jgi:NodT family efflux transporter outer membrane factor (OMF) lipoprotein
MKDRKCAGLLLAAGLGLFIGGCAHFERGEISEPVEMAGSYAGSRNEAASSAGDTNRWWTAFGDEQLNLLIAEAISSNFGLEQARQRLEQAYAVARKAGAAQIPQVNFGANAAAARTQIQLPTGGTTLRDGELYGLNLAASYELDLWGRVSASKRAAVIDAQAASDNLETAAMSLAAQVADTWYRLSAFEEQLNLLKLQIKNSEDQVHLLEMRFSTGQATSLDVWQQREQLASLRTLPPPLEAAIAVTGHQLALLLGRRPQDGADFVVGLCPELPPLPQVGIPADLLEKRPDVRAAMNRVRAADERVAAAVADRLPSLRLTASAGYSAPEMSQVFNDVLWNIAGNILMPVLDGGRRRAEADRAEAVMRERLAGYGAVLLTAMREVEDALVNESKGQEMLVRQQEQHEAADKTLYHAGMRYRRGLTDYLPVMNALNREQSLAQAMVKTRQQVLSYRIQLYRALGGKWMSKEFPVKSPRS